MFDLRFQNMNASEQSTNSVISKNASASFSTTRTDRDQSDSQNKYDFFFSIYEKLSKEVRLHRFITDITIFIISMQVILHSFWTVRFLFPINNAIGKFIRIITFSFLWYDPNSPSETLQPYGWISIGLIVLVAAYLGFFLLVYK